MSDKDFNQVKMSIEKRIGNGFAALNRKVIQESNWLNAVCDSKVFSNRNVLDFFSAVLIKMESKYPQNKTILCVKMAMWGQEGQMSCASFLVFDFIHQIPDAANFPSKTPEMNWSWLLSGAPWTPPRHVSLQTDPSVSQIPATSLGFSVPQKVWLTPNSSFLKGTLVGKTSGNPSKPQPFGPYDGFSVPHTEGPRAVNIKIVPCLSLDPYHVLALFLPSWLNTHIALHF